MNRVKRPISVTILAGLYIATGVAGFVSHFQGMLASPFEGIAVEIVEIVAVLCGAFLFLGRNWARWVALAWIALHLVLSAFHTLQEFAQHALFCVAIAWTLFSPGAARYFSPRATEERP